MRVLVLLALLAVAGRSAWAQTAHPYNLFLSDWRPPPGQRCELGNEPDLSTLVDTTALYARLGGGGSTRGSVLLAWTRPDTIGQGPEYGPVVDSLFVLERRLPDSTATLVHNALLATLKQSADAPSAALLRLDFYDHPMLRTARSLSCPPLIIQDGSLDKYNARLRALAGQGPRNAVIGLIVGRDGVTHEPRIITSSGDTAFDMEALGATALLHYRPALSNRVPVAVYVRLPVHAQQRMQ